VFDQLTLAQGMRLIELGCGPADLWRENQERLPLSMDVLLGDLSSGMVAQARTALKDIRKFHFVTTDAQAIPAPGDFFDRAVANHMLYHVPDISCALREIHRVLKPGGWLIAATNGAEHMRELEELTLRFSTASRWGFFDSTRFGLETGPELLEQFFDSVDVRHYEENLVVTELEPLLAYIFSTSIISSLEDENVLDELEKDVRRQFDEKGVFRITKSQGVILGRKR
jgi:ubiquinone/menaquinone biosynthesis C-methylase UbiE